MSTYRVVGNYSYRGHAPGTVFQATLEPMDERRALRRKNIVLLDSSRVTIDPQKIRRP